MVRNVITALLAGLALAGCTSGEPGPSDTADSPTAPAVSSSSAAGCTADYTPQALPAWATAGFTHPDDPMPYVRGDRGEIVAIVWAEHDPVVVPPRTDRNNKILWVARQTPEPGEALRVTATLEGTSHTVERTFDDGPGPSVLDLPEAGCWSMDLAWGDRHDHLRLRYADA